MSSIDRWGVTRSPDGTLADLQQWPWYWRYPVGILLLFASIAAIVWIYSTTGLRPIHKWLGFLGAGTGVLWALIFMREFGCLTVVIAVVGGLWLLQDTFLPDFQLPHEAMTWLGWMAVAWVGWIAYQALEKASQNQKAVENIWQRLNRLEGDPYSDEPTSGLAEIGRRLYRIEDRLGLDDLSLDDD